MNFLNLNLGLIKNMSDGNNWNDQIEPLFTLSIDNINELTDLLLQILFLKTGLKKVSLQFYDF